MKVAVGRGVTLCLICCTAGAGTPPNHGYGSLPLRFERNVGQAGRVADYVARTPGYTAFLNATSAQFHVGGATFAMQLIGASSTAPSEPTGIQKGKSNYLFGSSRRYWRTGVPAYSEVSYPSIYPGIDLTYLGKHAQFEYDFSVQPGADYTRIHIRFSGTQKISVDSRGALVLRTAGRSLSLKKPQIYQIRKGRKHFVKGRYVLDVVRQDVTFQIPTYESDLPLVIDPIVSYASYFGGSGNEAATSVAADASGSVYVAGWTESIDFPEASPLQAHRGGSVDAFVFKIDATGKSLSYATYLGGVGDDRAFGIGVDSSGEAVITGWTYSSNFPVLNAVKSNLGGARNAFVTKLNSAGSSILFSTYLGGSGEDAASAVTLDPAGSIYVTGGTNSPNFPTTSVSLSRSNKGLQDAFIVKLSAAGAMLYGTYLGGSSDDFGTAITAIGSGIAYITGFTQSTDFPTATPVQPANAGGQDAFVAKLNTTTNSLMYSTYFGGRGGTPGLPEQGMGLVVDASGNAYIAGLTSSADLPLLNPVQATFSGGGTDAFLAEFDPSGALLFSSYLGGSGMDAATGVAVGLAGIVYITGYTSSTDFPTSNAVQQSNEGGYDAFLVSLNVSAHIFTFGTYLGGRSFDSANGVALDSAGNFYVVGQTLSSDFPASNTVQTSPGGGYDAFVLKVSPGTAVSVSVAPSTAAIGPGQTRQFQSVVTGATNSSVSWSVSPPIGSISTAGLYSAPKTVPLPQSVSIVAQSAQDSTKTAVAYLSISAATLAVSQDPSTGSSQLWFLDSSGAVLANLSLAGGSSWRIVGVGDFNRDGYPDIVWQDPASGAVQIWFLGGPQGNAIINAVTLTIANAWRIVGCGDFDHDGYPDLLWQDPLTGHAQIWFLGGAQGTSLVGAVNLTNSNPWHIVGAGDFNGDGHLDAVWQDPATGVSQVWYLGGAQGNVLLSAATLSGPNAWRIASVTDYNGDGHPDLAWRDPTSGASQVWYLGGAAGTIVIGAGSLPSVGMLWIQ